MPANPLARGRPQAQEVLQSTDGKGNKARKVVLIRIDLFAPS